jgi:hypothetical protein
MKTVVKISLIALLACSVSYANSKMKKYDIKSAKIEYSINSSGSILGMKTQEVGKKRVIFDDYGIKELREESKVKKMSGLGQNKIDKSHKLIYMNNLIIYKVDFKDKNIIRIKNEGVAAMASLLGGDKNLMQTGEEMLKKMGGKKIGSDKVAGYKCDVWDLKGVKQCIYKGVTLRIESEMMGIKSTEVATKAEFGLSLSKDDFKLPNFPIYQIGANYQKKPKPIDMNRLEEMDKKENEQTSKEGAMALKGIGAVMTAAVKAGYDPKSGKDMTPKQEEIMQKAMMSAMGGEKAILAKMKQEMLSEMKDIPKTKKCFKNANSVEEANQCEREIDAQEPEVHKKWNDKIKTDLLKKISEYENSMSCVQKAQTMKALESCFPEER